MTPTLLSSLASVGFLVPMSEQPAYYAIIPADVRYSNVTANAKLLYGEITALSNKSGYCWASNEYFAKLYGVHSDTISGWIRELREALFVASMVDKGTQRRLFIIDSGRQNHLPPSVKSPTSGRQKDRHNNKENSKANTSEPKGSPFEVVPFLEEEEKRKTPPKYPNAPAVLKLFSIIGNVPANWKINTAQLKACENLYKERGLEKIESALEFYSETREVEFCPQITTPFDLDSKWTKLGQFKLKQ